MQAMIGTCVSEEDALDAQRRAPPTCEDEGAEAATAAPRPEKALVQAAIKKRKLYRQVSGAEVPWAPRDSDIELLEELRREAGMPRRVYFGAPAGGAGIRGCLEMGPSVLALCYDERHRTRLAKFLTERAVEAMLGTTTMAFSNDALVARSAQLRLTKAATATDQDDKKEDKKEDNTGDKKEDPEGRQAGQEE